MSSSYSKHLLGMNVKTFFVYVTELCNFQHGIEADEYVYMLLK